MSTKDSKTEQPYTLQSVRRSSSDWVFCNTKLEPYPNPWSREYRCPKCGNTLVNIIGTCATKVYK
jgi:predicted RNA-binding Zn-ribbon protein involved in translation (DUF1610 family)